MTIPEDRRYTKDHEWIKVEGGVATIGITQFAQEELGELVFVELPAVGKTFKKGDTLCVVESTKAASDVYAPLAGTVKAANGVLSDTPSLVNSNPYEEGWMVKLEKLNDAELAGLLSAADYSALLGKK